MFVSNEILSVVTFLYLLLFLGHLVYFATKKEKVLTAVWVGLYVTFGIHTAGLIARWIESYGGITEVYKCIFQICQFPGHAPLSNFYESLIFYAWCIALIVIAMKKRLRFPLLTMFACLVALGFMGYASFSTSVDKKITPLIPALQSNWLHIHVFTCFIAYAAFAVSFLAGLFSIVNWKSIMPPEETLEELNYRSVMVGFPMLSAGILTGAVWAHYAWGSYWSWDPKETWSLITWIFYALFLHARFARGWKGRRIALLSIIGFASVIFTYFGVNFILSGLHSYGAA
ncbi:MAG TPA: cytochrome c biogenesis protein [Syntrophorhabdales bacterium]|nr:cytochrome c biogenesis protein [Syntrophorhabdales bacterium]